MWAEFKQSMKVLARSISKYADLLIMKRIRMEAVHSSPDVVGSIGGFWTIYYTDVGAVPPPFLMSVIDAVTALGTNVPWNWEHCFLKTDEDDLTGWRH